MRKLAGQDRKRGEGLKRTLRLGLAAACLLALAAIAAVRAYQSANSLLGAALAGPEQIAAITALPEESAGSCVLHWNGEVLPYDAAQNLYCLPQPLDGAATGNLSASWGSLYLPADQWAGGWQEAMETGEARDIYVSDGRRFCRLQVYVSGLPALVIHTDSSEPYRLDPAVVGQTMANLPLAYNYGELTLFWPDGNLRAQTVHTGVEWHWRGNASLFAQKKSYRLNLLDERGQDTARDLLGLGEENGWVLVNFSTDCTRVRDKVATDLWNELAAASEHDPAGAEMEYVELYLDDAYMGVYGLCRSLSRKSMELSGQDVLYKWRRSAMIDDETFDQLEQQQSTEWMDRLEVVWPNVWQAGVWEPLRGYVNAFYRGDAADRQTLQTLASVENIVDMALYKQFTCALDNLLQNQYFLYASEESLFYRLPWDMNYTFGDGLDRFLALDLTTLPIRDLELEALYDADPEGTRSLVAGRWSELRGTVFSLEHLEERFRAETEVLTASGAWARDYALWGETGAYEGLSEIRSLPLEETLEFMKARLDFLDGYLADYIPAGQEVFDAVP